MTNVERERAWIGNLYPGKSWKKKVSKMGDAQVLAIYLREKRKADSAKNNSKESEPDADTPF